MTTPRSSLSPLLLVNLLSLLVLLAFLPLASLSAFDENEASWTRGRWDTAPFKLPLPFKVLRGGGEEGEKENNNEEAKSPSSSSSSSSFSAPSSSSSSTFPASSLLGPLSDSSLALSAAAREQALTRDDWQLDEEDVSAASRALACDACRAAVSRGWELGAGWVALQGRAEAKKTTAPTPAPAAAAAAAAASPVSSPAQQQQQQQRATTTETVFLLPAQLRQRLQRGVRAWCETEGRQGGASRRGAISPGSALEGAKLVREQGGGGGGGGGKWRRVERPLAATAEARAAAAKAATTGARERLAARLSCSSLLFSPPPPSSSSQKQQQTAPGSKREPPPDPLVVAALADGLSLFASALSRAANSNNAAAETGSNTKSPRQQQQQQQQQQQHLLPPTLFPGRRPDESGRFCADYHPECAGWASLGECEANPGYMLGDDDEFFGPSVPPGDSGGASGSSSSSSSASSSGGGSSGSKDKGGSSAAAQKRRRPGFCRFSCGVCSPLPRGFPSSSVSTLAAVARLPAKSQEAAALEAEAAAIKEGVLLRACYAAKPCGGRGGGEKRFGKWFREEDEEDEEEEERESTSSNSTPLPSSSASLHKRCFVSAAGWWLYEVCVGGGIRQFHPPTGPRDAPAANSLGTFSNDSSPSSSSPGFSKGETKWLSAAELYRGAPLREEAVEGGSKVFAFVEQRYEGGDPCGESEEEEEREGATRRSATLRLVCPSHASARDVDAVPRLLVAEPATCVYVLTLFHPDACALVNAGAKVEDEETAAVIAAAEAQTKEAAAAATTEDAAAVAPAEPATAVAAAAAVVPETPPAVPPPPTPAPVAAHDEL